MILGLLEKLKAMRILHWRSEGSNGDDYVEYRVDNGLFNYWKNKERRDFSWSSQLLGAGKPWSPP
jgi:hypothetical protein